MAKRPLEEKGGELPSDHEEEDDVVLNITVENMRSSVFPGTEFRCLTCFVRYADVATFPCGHVGTLMLFVN